MAMAWLTYNRRLTAVAILLFLFTLYRHIDYLVELSWRTPDVVQRHQITRLGASLSKIKPHVIEEDIIGFYTDAGIAEYYQAQYFLAPVVVARQLSYRTAVAYVTRSMALPRDSLEAAGWLVADSADRKVFLLSREEP